MVKAPGDRRRRSETGGGGEPRQKMSKGQELALFVLMMLVLLSLVVWGLRA